MQPVLRYTTLFFDVDDTLYDKSCGLWDAIRERMVFYMDERMHLPAAEIAILQRQYYETYGTTLRGLQIHHQVDTDDFLAYVHDLPLVEYLAPVPGLRSLLLSLPQQRWVFTNADSAHAGRVLKVLGLEDCFHGLVDVRAVDFLCKPHPEAYLHAMQAAGETDPERCVLFDDSPRNLAPARKLGFTTVLVGARETAPAACLSLPDLLALPELMPELWDRK